MYACARTRDTDRLLVVQWQSAVRDVDARFSTLPPQPKLSEEEAKKVLEKWLGNLGTWVAGEKNVLVCHGVYSCNGKEYYQFALQGFVFDHYSTLTFYVISADGTEMFEGQCSNGYLNRF